MIFSPVNLNLKIIFTERHRHHWNFLSEPLSSVTYQLQNQEQEEEDEEEEEKKGHEPPHDKTNNMACAPSEDSD